MTPLPNDAMSELLTELRGVRDELRQIREANTINAKPSVLLTPETLAAMLEVSPRTLRSWRHAGEVPAPIEIGGQLRWRRTDIDAWLKAKGRAS